MDASWARSTPAMLEAIEGLVAVESPSDDLVATGRCADAVAALGHTLLGTRPERLIVDGRAHLRWRFGDPRILLLGHLDTVWPLGTLARWPFAVADGRATGPGVFDMKAGLVQGLFALAALEDRDGLVLLVTSDEELGSPSSRGLVEETARGLDAALVLEPSAAGAVKTGRKGVALYRVDVEGRAAHAGLEPENGVNALVELAHQVVAIARLGTGETSVTPTVASAGTASNVVPARATVLVDVRAPDAEAQARVDGALHALRPTDPAARLRVSGGENRPPLPPAASAALHARARALAADLGLGPLPGVTVGGGSDGNFTAGVGTPTLDGLGAIGAGAHAEGEYVEVAALAARAALVSALVRDLRRAAGARSPRAAGGTPHPG